MKIVKDAVQRCFTRVLRQSQGQKANQTIKVCSYLTVTCCTMDGCTVEFFDTDPTDNGREKSLTGVRLFKDQLEALRWLCVHKYRNNRRPAELIREAIDRFIESEKK